ncbi:uncharacterized protein [Ptychodera flava]|uniref:uncharacterized protein n=1 Tax=Ptychodera flava TaxID=63121 RepID=UPI00396A8789
MVSNGKTYTLSLCVLLATSPFFKPVSSTTCAINQAHPATDPGNSHVCPDNLPDGTPNDFNNCCWNDRPDADGNYHSCCQDDSARAAAQMNMLVVVMVPIGSVLGVLFALVVVWTYCRDDTVKFLKPIRKRLRRWWDIFNDAICFCTCCPKRCRRNMKKDDVPTQTQPDVLDPTQEAIDPFWM